MALSAHAFPRDDGLAGPPLCAVRRLVGGLRLRRRLRPRRRVPARPPPPGRGHCPAPAGVGLLQRRRRLPGVAVAPAALPRRPAGVRGQGVGAALARAVATPAWSIRRCWSITITPTIRCPASTRGPGGRPRAYAVFMDRAAGTARGNCWCSGGRTSASTTRHAGRDEPAPRRPPARRLRRHAGLTRSGRASS